ncbi:MAG: hypothetical protein MUF18_06090 [Fimbriiglobus sp.]|jgi:hypothetical protein|nr:hypothetical protein [Fimbriiglobus sp.]
MPEPSAHLVFLRSGGLLLVKRPDWDWRRLQDEVEDYMASLGPGTAAEIAGHFTLDYGEDDSRWPIRRSVIEAFMLSGCWLMSDGEAGATP